MQIQERKIMQMLEQILMQIYKQKKYKAGNEVLPKKQKKNHRKKMMESKGTSIGALFLKAATRTDFYGMRLKVIEKFGLTKYDIPSYHYMTIHWPKFDTGILQIDPEYRLISRESQLKKKKEKT